MDFGGFLICYTRGFPKPSASEKNSVAICGGANLNLTGLMARETSHSTGFSPGTEGLIPVSRKLGGLTRVTTSYC
jgi:hypothetical protein